MSTPEQQLEAAKAILQEVADHFEGCGPPNKGSDTEELQNRVIDFLETLE